jgi:hypothetical protein
MEKSDFKVICPFCKKENEFIDDNWHDELIDDSDTSVIPCMHCDFPMEITTNAVYTLSVDDYDPEMYEPNEEY